jgi:hypothetical protein
MVKALAPLPNETVLARAVVAIKLTEIAKVAENEKQLNCCMVGDQFNTNEGRGKGKVTKRSEVSKHAQGCASQETKTV